MLWRFSVVVLDTVCYVSSDFLNGEVDRKELLPSNEY